MWGLGGCLCVGFRGYLWVLQVILGCRGYLSMGGAYLWGVGAILGELGV